MEPDRAVLLEAGGMLMASTAGTVGLYTVSGMGGAIFAAVVSQWNQWRQHHRDGKEKDITARVADTEAALAAWDRINQFQAAQITTLTGRVNDLEARIEAYESNVIPQLQSVIDGLRVTVSDKQRTIDEQQRTIADLLGRIDALQQGGTK